MAKRTRIISGRRRRRMAEHLALVVLALQCGLLVALALTPGDVPPRLTLFELLWAAARRPMFYPLVAVLTAGPALTVAALRVRGRHRVWLAVAWPAFVVMLVWGYGAKVALMLRVLWWQVGG